MNLEDPASPGGGQAPKKIEAYQCNLCPAVFGFKFNAKRHFQKLHPDDEYDGSKIANIKFKCYGCQWGLDTYGNLEAHFAQNHQGQVLNPEKVYLGDTQTTAATFQSVKRMKTPSKRKRPAESLSRPSSASGAMQHPGPPTMSSPQHVQHVQPLPGQQQQPPLVPHSHMMMGHPLESRHGMGPHSAAAGNPTPPASSVSTYQGDLLCNSCEFTCDNPQSLALHQQTHVQPSHYGNQQNHEQQQMQSQQPQSQQGYNYPGAHHGNNGGSDLFMDFKVEEENLQHQYQQQHHQMYHQQPYHGHSAQQQQQHPYPSSEQGYQQHQQGYGQPHPHLGYGSYNNHQMPHQYQQQQYHHYSHMQQHVPPPHAPGQHGHQQQPLPPEHHTPTPPPTTILSPPLPTPPPHNQYQAPTPPHQQPPPQYQEVPHPHYQQHTPPPPHQQQAPLPQQQQPMIPNNNSNSSNNSSPYHELDQKIIETEALRNQNGNGGETPPLSHHHFHDLYPPNQNSPRQQNGATSAVANNNIGGNGPYSNATSGGGGAYSPAASPAPVGGPKQRRTNIGKMFPTHICFVCDSRLAKLDCIKMHFKNKHVETPLDLNKVMITRVCCYLCGVRKKEYAILVRHFQVEHKDQPLDPFRIGMDEPTPFNLSPEAEAELQRLPIPDPVKHDPVKHRQTGPPKGGLMNDHDQRQLYGQGQHGQQQFSTPIPDENTLDSIGDEYTPPNHVMKEDTTSTGVGGHGGNGMEPLQDHPGPMLDSGGNGSGAIMKKKRRFNQAFKNNKCTACSKAFSRMTTAKKHFLDQHPQEMPFDKTKIEVTQLPCYLCDTLITDSRHALRHFETSHPGIDYDSRQVQVSGIELTNGDDLDESTEDLEANNSLAFSSASETDTIENHQMANSSSRGGPPNGGQADQATPKSGFRCFLCNYWCSTIEDFQVHFAPETKAHENVSEVTITCPVCMHKCETTEEMFDHLSNEHSTYDSLSKVDTEEDESAVSGQSADSTSADQQLTSARAGQTETAVGSSVNSVNSCVETC